MVTSLCSCGSANNCRFPQPTSGLEARAALLVIETLRKIADEGRTIISTIHQPSYAVFRLFVRKKKRGTSTSTFNLRISLSPSSLIFQDDLLLLKKGGQAVFFGELGPDCSNLVSYLTFMQNCKERFSTLKLTKALPDESITKTSLRPTREPDAP